MKAMWRPPFPILKPTWKIHPNPWRGTSPRFAQLITQPDIYNAAQVSWWVARCLRFSHKNHRGFLKPPKPPSPDLTPTKIPRRFPDLQGKLVQVALGNWHVSWFKVARLWRKTSDHPKEGSQAPFFRGENVTNQGVKQDILHDILVHNRFILFHGLYY